MFPADDADPLHASSAFPHELTPTWLHLACLLSGHRPPALGDGFRAVYFGGGTLPTLVAAVHPRAQVQSSPRRADDVEAAHRWAVAARLPNLTVDVRPGLPVELAGPLADLVVVEHLSTAGCDDDAADRLAAAVDAGLRPGGLLAVTYHTTVGWSEITPVLRVVRRLATRHTGHPERLVPELLDLLGQLRRGGARHLTHRPAVAAWLDSLSAMSPEAIETAFLREELRPISHADLAARLRRAGCEFIGSADLARGIDLDTATETRALVAGAPSPVLQEAYHDLVHRPSVRVDLFRRGLSPLGGRQLDEALSTVELIDLTPAPPAAGDTQRSEGSSLGDRMRWLVASGRAHPEAIGGSNGEAAARAARLAAEFSADGIPLVPAPVIGSALPAATGTEILARVGAKGVEAA